MAKKLVIVESPSKAKTIGKYLGKDYEVIASQGHIIDLPVSKLGVDIENGFKPQYVTMKGKAKIIKEMKDKAKGKENIYIATDPDREGEAIAWHIKNTLAIDDNEKCRIEFNEITKNAVKNAVDNVRSIDYNLVDAQQARRVLDRIVGYKLSPVLWKKVKRGLSAGRVQSVALKIIIDREREIESFVPQEYWDLSVLLEKEKSTFLAKFYGKDNKKIELKDKKQVDKIIKDIDKKDYEVVDVKYSQRKKNPAPPFTTSSLQQEASRKLGFGVKKTMMIAQKLYEAGYITYMRTDSVRISEEARAMAKKYIVSNYSEKYYENRYFKTNQNAQDAHEAIRPSNLDNVVENLAKDEYKLYMLIVNRFLASQMAVAIYDMTKVSINVCDYNFIANGSVIKFDGFMRLYIEGKDKKDDEDENENILPKLDIKDKFQNKNLLSHLQDILKQA